MKGVLMDWLVEALEENDGRATIVEASKEVWDRHKDDLKDMDDLFYTWQYDLRWAAKQLESQGKLRYEKSGNKSVWMLE